MFITKSLTALFASAVIMGVTTVIGAAHPAHADSHRIVARTGKFTIACEQHKYTNFPEFGSYREAYAYLQEHLKANPGDEGAVYP